jgi:ABC-type Zn uptake system ZnuABC Zn-binding protein ZnuA
MRISGTRSLGIWALLLAVVACAPGQRVTPVSSGSQSRAPIRVLAVETFLADIAQNVAGDRLRVGALIPVGVDPHSFEPVPSDVRKVADCDVLITNGAGLEQFLSRLLQNAGGKRVIVEAAAGLASRAPGKNEALDPAHAQGDPHFWLDPNNVITYAQNIRKGLEGVDPEGSVEYAASADAYAAKLKELDRWIAGQVSQLPEARRLLVTNHETLGYFADRYGFTVIGTIIPSVGTDAAPSAQELTRLTDRMRQLGVKAIFLETGSNSDVANQIARETGSRVVTELYTHSISPPGGAAPTYLDMIRFNTAAIVAALK